MSVDQARRVPLDPALPTLQALFTHDGAPLLVAQAVSEMTGRQLDAEAAQVQYVRYRPGKSCVVGWSWQGDTAEPLLASGRLFHNDRVGKLLAKTSSQELIAAAASLAVTTTVPYRYVSEQRLLLQLFPLDLRLDRLVLAADERWLAERIGANGSKPHEVSVSAKPVSYKPWRRCVYRYDVEANGNTVSYYAKLFRDDRGAQLLEWHRAVTAALTSAQAPWTIPTAQRYLAEARMLLFDAVDDVVKVRTLLRPALKDAAARTTLLRDIAAAAEGLAALQRSHIGGLPSQTPRELIGAFRRDCQGIDAVAPGLARQATDAIDELASAAGVLPAERLVPTHGAFRHDQLLDADGRLIVLDLDTICSSGESADAGNFLGYLDLTAVRRPRLQPIIDDCAQTFVETLSSIGLTSPAWVAWYRAAAHVKKALRSFFALEPGWPETSERMLSLARATVRDGRSL